jgi:hypothetical protein
MEQREDNVCPHGHLGCFLGHSGPYIWWEGEWTRRSEGSQAVPAVYDLATARITAKLCVTLERNCDGTVGWAACSRNTEKPQVHLNNILVRSVPHSKHSVFSTKSRPVMLFGELVSLLPVAVDAQTAEHDTSTHVGRLQSETGEGLRHVGRVGLIADQVTIRRGRACSNCRDRHPQRLAKL